MTSTITPTRVKNRSETSRRAHTSRPDSGRRTGRRAGGTSAASRRAYDRRQRRTGATGSAIGNGGHAVRLAGPRELARRIPFVVFVMMLFLAGMGITLWLTTNATARSYQIADAQQQNSRLEDKKESLEKIVQAGSSAPELARKAAELGMVQSEDVARLVVAPDGSVTVHGEPKPAEGPKPGDLARVPAIEDAVAPSAGAPGAGAPGAGAPSPDGVLPPADAAPIPPADAAPAPPADTDVMAAPAEPAPPAAGDDPAAPGPEQAAPAAPAQTPAAPAAGAAPIPPADEAPEAPADAARGDDGPAGAPSEGAH